MDITWNSRMRRRFNRMNPAAEAAGFGEMLDYIWNGGLWGRYRQMWWVDQQGGNDSNDGKSADRAKQTIAAAVTARNADIDWSTWNEVLRDAIFLYPGVYAENLTAFPYHCDVIGLGMRGTDTAAEIHPSTGICIAGTMLGTGLYNLRLETNSAGPILDVGICNNSRIQDCTFTNGAAVGATAVDTDNCTHLWFENNDVESGQTTGMAYGLYFRGGANKYAHNVRILANRIQCTTAGVFIQNTCTASQCIIAHNLIYRPTKGIDDNNGGSICYGNFISASSDAIEHANSSTQCIDNRVINNATGAKETTNT